MKAKKWEDHYTRKARAEKWSARSVYKLQEIDRKFKLIGKADRLLDLGCYPGSWTQYGLKRVGPGGEIVGIDLKEPAGLSRGNFRFIKADVFTLEEVRLSRELGAMDVVLSDLAPRTTGIRNVDAGRSEALSRKALDIARSVLKRNGHFVCKIFEGEGTKALRTSISHCFRQHRAVRPEAVRKGSREIYLVGLGFSEP